MLTLQEQFEIDYPNKFVQKIDADKKYPRLIFANYDLDLNEYKNLKDLSLGSNQINSLNISQLSNLTLINLHNCPLTSLKLPPGLIIKM
jgi:Leucine-rich repeat (LRR) protein